MDDAARAAIRQAYLAGETTADIAAIAGVSEAEAETYLLWWCDRDCEGGEMDEMHLMTIGMGNMCGEPTPPTGTRLKPTRATSVVADVTCDACVEALIKAAVGTDELRRIADEASGRQS